MAKKTLRPVRTLLVFGLTIVLLYGLAALGQTWKPGLGLDLEGGTRITLSAIPSGGAITQTKLKQAAGIVDARVNGSGVSEAEVTTQGDRNIIVEIPGANRTDLVDRVKRTAQLRFRLVVGGPQPGTPEATDGASPSASPTGSPSGTPTPKAGSTKTPKASEGSATPNPRPAPFAKPQAKKTPKPTAKASPAATSPSDAPSEPAPAEPAPTGNTPTEKGASVDDPLAWSENPGTEWLVKFAQFTCPTEGEEAEPVADNADEPLIACDDEGLKFLLSKSVIEGTELKSASYGIPQNGTTYAVNLGFKSSARTVFGDTTTALNRNGGTFAIVLDGKVVSYAGVNEPILDGNAQITGDFSEAEASSLANSLKFGALPIKFAKPTVETIGPSLAGNQLAAGILAGIVGLAIVMLYCLIYYRGLGTVVVASLVVAAVVTYAVVLVLSKAAGFTLTLPGIAGLIVAVGITADSFIVYFERIRDEMRDGKSMRVAVETGWARARNTCLAADAVSLLAAIVLYIFAIGVVRGFAFALGISTLIDLAVFFYFTKPMMTVLARRIVLQHRPPVLRPVPGDTRHRRTRPRCTARGRAFLMGKVSRLGNALYEGDVSIDFVGRKWLWYAISGMIVLLAVSGLYFKGLNFGIEFEGGVEYTISLPADQVTQDNVDKVRTAIADTGLDQASAPIVNTSGADSIRAQTEELSNDEALQVSEAIAAAVGVDAKQDISTSEVGASWGAQVANRALTGLVVFLILVVLFIWAYFREWKMSVAAMVALMHDLVITVGVYALSGFEVSPATVTGVLTILGFSLYDTVVVFDKVRENTRSLRKGNKTYAELANLAVNQTLVRSINTTLVALLPVGALLYVGVATLGSGALKDLALSLFVGMAAGAYSSIFIATPLAVQLKSREKSISDSDARARCTCPSQRGPLRRGAGVLRGDAAPRGRSGLSAGRSGRLRRLRGDDEDYEDDNDAASGAAPVPAPPRRPEASGSGRVVPASKKPVTESGSAHRTQPTRQPRSKRNK